MRYPCKGMVTGTGKTDRTLTADEIRDVVAAAAKALNVVGKRILTIIPDGTRTMPMPLLFEMLQQEIGGRAAACDYLVALGTHPLMRDAQLTALVGQPVINGACGASKNYEPSLGLAGHVRGARGNSANRSGTHLLRPDERSNPGSHQPRSSRL